MRFKLFKEIQQVVAPRPTPLSTFTFVSKTSTSITGAWTGPADSTVDGFNIYRANGTLVGTASAGSTRGTAFGLTPNTQYNLTVKRFNETGESDASPVLTVTTDPATTNDTVYMGSSLQATNPGGYSQWDAVRVYRFGALEAAMAYQPKIVCMSDDDGIPVTGGQASADLLRTKALAFFRAHPTTGLHYCDGNELDRKSPNMTALRTTLQAMRVVVDEMQDLGYDMLLGLDLTQNNIRNSHTVQAQLKNAAADIIEFFGVSFYPPGRLQTTTDPTFTPYATYIDPCFDQAVDWGIGIVECWEFGIPVDPNDKTKRPAYVSGAVNHMIAQGQEKGIKTPAMVYWDNWKGQTVDNPNNRFTGDNVFTPRPNPSTAAAWRLHNL